MMLTIEQQYDRMNQSIFSKSLASCSVLGVWPHKNCLIWHILSMVMVVEASKITRQTSKYGIECRRGNPNVDKIPNLLWLAMKDMFKLCMASPDNASTEIVDSSCKPTVSAAIRPFLGNLVRWMDPVFLVNVEILILAVGGEYLN